MTIAEHLQRKYPGELLTRILGWVADPKTWQDGDGRTHMIGVRHVVAYAWNGGRLSRALQQLDAGTAAPPIIAYRIRFYDGSYLYNVGDGLHRTMAARTRGHTSIRARVEQTARCRQPRAYVWEHGNLWEDCGADLSYRLTVKTADERTIMGALTLLGLVRPVSQRFPPFLRMYHPDYQTA
jgi:hypothetical protein